MTTWKRTKATFGPQDPFFELYGYVNEYDILYWLRNNIRHNFCYKGRVCDRIPFTSINSSLPVKICNKDSQELKMGNIMKNIHRGDGIPGDKSEFHQESFQANSAPPIVNVRDDLSKRLRIHLIVGRILGVLPISGLLFKKSCLQYRLSLKSPSTVTSLTIFVVLVINFSLGAIESFKKNKSNPYDIAQSVRGILQDFWACLIYLYFLVRGNRFVALFDYWAKTSEQVHFFIEDRHLKRDSILITIFVLLSAILENAVLHLDYKPQIKEYANMSILETYYRTTPINWSNRIPYHEVVSVIVFVQHKCMLYSCNFVDIMITVFSRALYFRFKSLNEMGYEHLAKPPAENFGLMNKIENSPTNKSLSWSQLAKDHKALCSLLRKFDNFFSPLIFGSYAVNIFYICVQLLDGITVSHRTLVYNIYAHWSFLHIIMRVLLVSVSAARINHYAHQIRYLLEECPNHLYTNDVLRLDAKVTSGPDIGLSGLGAVTVTKPFILAIISVVFTFEIILLQGKPITNSDF